nr:hypothetical protein GCM10020093_044390 [Planobispora longispora]
MAAGIGPVTAVGATGGTGESVRRTGMIPRGQTGGLAVLAASSTCPAPSGPRWTGACGSTRRRRRSARRCWARWPRGGWAWETGDQVWIAGQWWTVVGVLEPSTLAPEIDRSVLVGFEAARRHLGSEGNPTTLYVRSDDASVAAVRDALPRTVNPENPEEVEVSRPSDALEAKAAADGAFTNLLLGVGAVALLVGGVGVANTMVISVLERRREIGLRRSLGATRGQVRSQFLAESLLLSGMGGVAGAALGAAVTVGYAAVRDLPAVVPAWALAGGLAATLIVGTAAGIYPAARAARMSPTLALNTT